jgi:hypothetical protein
VLLAAQVPAAGRAASDVAHGNYMGSGHTCYGMLTITSRRITWMTPGSECRSSPYFIRDRQEWRSGIRITYQLAQRSSKCLFDALVLTHDSSEDNDIGWEVTGYPSLDSAALDRAENTLACYLYRY